MLLYNPYVNTKFEIARDIKLAREALDLTQEKICEILGVNVRTIQRIEAHEDFDLNKENKERFYSFVFSRIEGFNKLRCEIRKEVLKPDEVLLFHGSKNGIEGSINPKKSSPLNDFGQGFYAGETYEQSVTYICESPESSAYLFRLKKSDLTFKTYGANLDWLLAVGYNRGMLNDYLGHPLLKKAVEESEKYDVIIAPIADNRMFVIIDQFLEGEITDQQCIHCLAATHIGSQYVLKTKKACDKLKMLEHFYICQDEKKKFSEIRTKEASNAEAKVRLARSEYQGKGKYIVKILC